MATHTFFCIDGHTCGNPVRLVAGGAPTLQGATMIEKRAHFLAEFDWIRTALMFEPRGHDMMSGSILMAPTRPDCDAGILFIETSGCLPMCGHGTIGTVTMAIERGLIQPKTPGVIKLDAPAGVIIAHYQQTGPHVDWVRIVNVPSYLHVQDVTAEVDGIGTVTLDIAYGGNFYAIVDPQKSFPGLENFQPSQVLSWAPRIRRVFGEKFHPVHAEKPEINGLSHVMFTGAVLKATSTARNAVFYGDKAIDRSPCGTGTSARMAQWSARGKLKAGDRFVHESIIGSEFIGRIEGDAMVGAHAAIIPSIEGWARLTGYNTLFVDDRDPYWRGFQVVDGTPGA